MPFALDADLVEPFVRGLWGAVDVDGGPTDEQRAVLDALVRHLWHRDDLVGQVEPMTPAAVARAVAHPVARRRFHEVLLTLEVCRHPLTAAQVDRVDEYGAALDFEGPDLQILRDLTDRGVGVAAADFARFLDDNLSRRHEPGLRLSPVTTTPEPELAAAMQSLAHLPEGTLGRALLDFYDRAGLSLPGVEGSGMNHWFVAHDTTHVIAGIEPTGPGEVALSAFQVAMDDNDVNRGALLASLVVHEAGFAGSASSAAESGILATPGAAELLGQEMERGAACRADFSLVDHMALFPRPLAEVREQFGVGRPVDPADGHHCW
ncbi:MAG: hypothetical protein ACKO04_01410 [Actinomycetes bacterium]